LRTCPILIIDLVNVAEFRVPVSEILDLSGADTIETMIAFSQIALPVFPLAVSDTTA
jgi:hypothetical protein